MKHYEKPSVEIIAFETYEDVLANVPGATPGTESNTFDEDDFE